MYVGGKEKEKEKCSKRTLGKWQQSLVLIYARTGD